ncbi:MAG: hypothetical protein K2Q18_12765 [Bdellovibrionales bacterium]|nr:hypothetical protein [Bdellovibrionales bacterium]
MIKIFLILGLLLVASCATEEKQIGPKTYSQETNQAFEMIERGGSYYLKKAPEKSRPPQIEQSKRTVKKPTPPPQPKESEDLVIDEKINYQEKEISTPKQSNTKTLKNSERVDERLVEINQHLAFYCMRHRSDLTFKGSEEKCMAHVENVQKSCQKKHRLVNAQLLSCIKSGLKK